MNKQQTIELLQKQIPSFYSLEQVIKIISGIEDNKSEINDGLIEGIVDEIADQGRYLIDDYDLEMSYKEVELSSVDIDRDVIRKAIQSAINSQ